MLWDAKKRNYSEISLSNLFIKMPFSYLTMLSHLERIKTVRLTGLGHYFGTWLFCLSKHHAVLPLPHAQFLGICPKYKSGALHFSIEQGAEALKWSHPIFKFLIHTRLSRHRLYIATEACWFHVLLQLHITHRCSETISPCKGGELLLFAFSFSTKRNHG